MNCKNCNAPLADDAVFCGDCGIRVDGKKACENCGNMNADTQKYCSYCGARIDGVTVCKNCGKEYEGEFCPHCGAAKGVSVVKPVSKGKTITKGGVNNLMRILAMTFALVSASLAFIFTFFIGTRFDGMLGSLAEDKKFGIFAYLIDSLKKPSDYAYYTSSEKAVFHTQSIIEFLIAMATVVLVLIFTILTIVKYVREMKKKETTVCIRYGVVAAIVYIIGASLLYSLERVSGTIEVDGLAIELEIESVFNAATIVGVIFCTVFVVGSFVCKMLENFSAFKARWFTVRKLCAFIGGSVALAAFVTAIHTGLTFEGWEYDSYSGYTEMEISASPIAIAATGKAIDAFLGITAQLTLTTAIVFLGVSLIRWITNATEKEYKSGLVWSILALAFACVATVFVILQGTQFMKSVASDGSEFVEAKWVLPILTAVFSLINLGAAIAGKIVCDKNQEE